MLKLGKYFKFSIHSPIPYKKKNAWGSCSASACYHLKECCCFQSLTGDSGDEKMDGAGIAVMS